MIRSPYTSIPRQSQCGINHCRWGRPTHAWIPGKQEWMEFGEKMGVLYKNAFGDSREDMIEIEGLATAPAQQGKGYGTLLMLFVNAMADVQRRGVYLVTCNTHEFYQRFGYSIVQQDVLGVDNPEWKGDPVPLRIMYRKPRSFPIMAEDDKTSLP
ncbi:hypothetical protein C2E23DRAFT_536770 [Lenzites betulinus]|nr:hypothetical protein C2E23DRAFT_536770 [Lenzites betulinus]